MVNFFVVFFCFACHIKKQRKEMGVLGEILFVRGLLLKINIMTHLLNFKFLPFRDRDMLLVPNLVRQQL